MNKTEIRGVFFVVTAAFFWGILGIMVNYINSYSLGAFEAAFLRLFFGSFLLGIFLIIKDPNSFRVKPKELVFCLMIGFICQGFFNIFFFNSLIKLGIIPGVIMLYTSPAFTLIFSRIILKSPLNNYKIIALIITFTGAFLTVSGGRFDINYNILGILFGVLAGASYGILPVFNKVISSRVNMNTILFYSFLAGCIVVTPFADLPLIKNVFLKNHSVAFVGISLGIFPAILAHFIFLKASKLLDPFKISIVSNFEVVVASVLAYIFYSEPLTLVKLIGIFFVISGTIIPQLFNKNKVIKLKKT